MRSEHQLLKFLSNIDSVNDDFMVAAEASSNPARWPEACGQGFLDNEIERGFNMKVSVLSAACLLGLGRFFWCNHESKLVCSSKCFIFVFAKFI